MSRRLALTAALVIAAAPAAAELRCGWISNPSPANWWMTDADGEWTISEQGTGWKSEVFDVDWAGTQEWVSIQSSYGYGCGCIEGRFDRESRWLTHVSRAEWLPLQTCDSDPALPSR